MIDKIEKGQVLMFQGQPCTVVDFSDECDTVTFASSQSEPFPMIRVRVYGKSMVMRESSKSQTSDFIPRGTKSEIDVRLSELRQFLGDVVNADRPSLTILELQGLINLRIEWLEKERVEAMDDIFSSIVASHKALCSVKQMGEKEAYGQNPAFYYGSAVAGEAGEMINKMIKALRNGGDATEALRAAILSELPDVIIYAFVLAYVLDIDLTRLVTEKANVVVERARSGHYGGPLLRKMEEIACPTCPTCPIKCDEEH